MAEDTKIVAKPDSTPSSTTLDKSLNTKLPALPVIGQTAEGRQYAKTAQAYGNQAAEAAGEVKRAELNQQAGVLGAQAQASRKYGEETKGMVTEAENKELEYPRPEFHPTKENAESLGQLFSLVATIGIMLGGGGKLASQNALSAMSGMLQGWQKGRKDLYEKELKEFDKEYQRINAIRSDIQAHLQRSLQLASTDKETASLEAQQAASIAGADSIVKAMVNQGKTQQALDLIKQTETIDQQVKQRQQQAAQHAQSMAMQRERLNFEKEKERNKQNQAKPLEDYFPGLVLDPKDKGSKDKRASIDNGAVAISEAQSLKEYVKQHPEMVGRNGQLSQNLERYVESFKQNPNQSDQGQPALVFAKKYAAYLVNYERSLSGSGRTTVAFQNRFNQLMKQDQFNAAGFDKLMNEQMSEVANLVASKDPAITGRGLFEYGQDIQKRATLPFDNTEPKTSSNPPNESGSDEKGKFHYEYNADRTKRRKVYE